MSAARPTAVPHPIPYQGSKRRIAPAILACFPPEPVRLLEPFAGSAAVSLAALAAGRAKAVVLADRNAPLAELWQQIVAGPRAAAALADRYEALWRGQHGRERETYLDVRAAFNRQRRPHQLLYLLARCVKAAVRYNRRGEFNQAADHRRRGVHPDAMRRRIMGAQQLLAGRAEVRCADFRDVLATAGPDDVVYLDPPYQGVSGPGDRRYAHGLAFAAFVAALAELVARDVPVIVSYDGYTGGKRHGRRLPASLGLTLLQVPAGRSASATLHGRSAETVESLYVSPALLARAAAAPRPRTARRG